MNEKTTNWYAVHTGFKREKRVQKQLERKGIEHYLPLQKRIRRYTRKVRQVELPLISTYIFVKIDLKDRVSVLEVPDVYGFVQFAKDIIPIPESEIALVKRVLGEAYEVEVEEGPLAPGTPVEIIGGQLTGLKGTLVEQAGKEVFNIQLDSLGYQLRMDVPRNLLQRI